MFRQSETLHHSKVILYNRLQQKIALYLWILLPHTYKQIIQNNVHDMYSLYYKSLNIEKKYQMQ